MVIFAQDTHCTSTVYRPRTTELSARGHSGTETCISGTGTCITHVKLEHEATSSKRGGNEITALQAYSTPTGKCRRKIPPLAKNEVMDKGARIENLQPARNQVVACACVFGVISHNLLTKLTVSRGVKSESVIAQIKVTQNTSTVAKNKNWDPEANASMCMELKQI